MDEIANHIQIIMLLFVKLSTIGFCIVCVRMGPKTLKQQFAIDQEGFGDMDHLSAKIFFFHWKRQLQSWTKYAEKQGGYVVKIIT